jgi:hypothetical protein
VESRRNFGLKSTEAWRWGGAALLAAAGGSAALAARAAGSPTPIDSAVPIHAAVVALAVAIAAERLASIVALGVPLLIVARFAIASEAWRLEVYGLILAGAAALAIGSIVGDGRVPTGRAIGLLVATLALFRLVPFDGSRFAAELVVIAGAALLAGALSRRGQLALRDLAFAFVVGAVALSLPLRAAGFPALVAALAWFVIGPSIFSFAAIAAVTIVCGRWAGPLAAIAIVSPAIAARKEMRFAALPVVASAANALASLRLFALLADPIAAASRRSSREIVRIALLLLPAIAALFLRPALALMYVLAAAVMISAAAREECRDVGLTAVLALFLVMLAAWSGAAGALLPLPATLAAVAAIVAIAIAGRIGLEKIALGIAPAALFVAVVAMHPAPPAASVMRKISLGVGESKSVTLLPPARQLVVVASAANLVTVTPGTRLGAIDLVDVNGRAYRRVIEAGDVSDWGGFRREHFFGTRAPLAADPLPAFDGYGADASLGGEARIVLRGPAPIAAFTIEVDGSAPLQFLLNVTAVEAQP